MDGPIGPADDGSAGDPVACGRRTGANALFCFAAVIISAADDVKADDVRLKIPVFDTDDPTFACGDEYMAARTATKLLKLL